MTGTGIATLLLIIANIAFSYNGFTKQAFFDGYKFEVDKIVVSKDYKRLLSSGFLHVNWTHLVFNMMTLYFFSGPVETYFGALQFLVIYFASLLGGNLLSLFVHRHHSDYSVVGASGAVCGIIFASIAVFPGMGINLFGIISMPGWLYGIAYVLFSIYGIRSKKDNIGHEAHLGGALVGMIVALLMAPAAIVENYVTILLIALPSIVFIYLIISRPQILLVDNLFHKSHQDHYSIDHKYNEERATRQKEVDALLDKIARHGIKSLSNKEKKLLKEYSQKID